jgi:hypothetical protein
MSTNYAVVTKKFAERHYISKFSKKYKGAWNVTWNAILEEFKRIDTLIRETAIAEVITHQGDIRICKTEFRVHGTQESRHASGNRCIISVDSKTCIVSVLLVYGKTDIGSGKETTQWKNIIKENYPEYSNLL